MNHMNFKQVCVVCFKILLKDSDKTGKITIKHSELCQNQLKFKYGTSETEIWSVTVHIKMTETQGSKKKRHSTRRMTVTQFK